MKEDDLRKLPSFNIPYSQMQFAKDNEGNLKIYDDIRKKFVNLTPEEFVRQNFTSWLIKDLGYPQSLMANEVAIRLNNTAKRCDTVVYDRTGSPLMIIEYKAPDIEITQDTFDQIVRYNMELKAKYLVVTNGVKNYCCLIDYNRNTYNFIRIIPGYDDATGMPGYN